MTYARVRDETGDLTYALSQMKFEVSPSPIPSFPTSSNLTDLAPCLSSYPSQSPSQGKEDIIQKLDKVHQDIINKFRTLSE